MHLNVPDCGKLGENTLYAHDLKRLPIFSCDLPLVTLCVHQLKEKRM